MTRRLSTAQAVQAIGRPSFRTKEIADLSGGSLSVTTRVLDRMARQGLIKKVVRGLWCIPSDARFSPYALVHYLSQGSRAYVSFVSALHLHGLIEQIPQIIYAATTGHTRIVRTSVGTFSYHRIAPSLFGGFDWSGAGQDFLVASPEKALVDSLYLSSRRGKHFRFFPELHIPRGFRLKEVVQWVDRVRDPLIRRHVLGRLRDLNIPGTRRLARRRSPRRLSGPVRTPGTR